MNLSMVISRVAVALLVLSAMSSFKVLANVPVKACGEPFPPYAYFKSNSENNQSVAGLHMGLLELVKNKTGLELTIDLISWKRCLKSAADYKDDGYEIAIDATFNEERAKDFYFVGPVYRASSAVFYSSARHPKGLLLPESEQPLTRVAEMQHYKICGALGWNYDVYYDTHGLPKTVVIDETPGPLGNVFKKIISGRCDVFESTTFLIAGHIATGELAWDEIVKCQKLAIPQVEFYFMVSKKSPRALELTTVLSNALISMQSSGELEKIYADGLKAELGSDSSLVACL